MSRKNPYEKNVTEAVAFFWDTRNQQSSASTDTSSRGAVVAGKQMDGFVRLLQQVAKDAGVPEQCIFTRSNYLPGYFRASKDWDFLIISPKSRLIAAIELKSQIGSYGNNLNNRAEEAIGSAEDFWVAFREGQFPNQREALVGIHDGCRQRPEIDHSREKPRTTLQGAGRIHQRLIRGQILYLGTETDAGKKIQFSGIAMHQ